MWPVRWKRHLRYASLEAWIEGEKLSVPLVAIADSSERDRRLAEYAELQQHLFDKHLATLTAEERRTFSDGTHPSLSHCYADRAKPFATGLQEHLVRSGFKASVEVGFYHLDRLVLSVDLESPPGDRRNELPWLFRGFETKYSWPQPELGPHGPAGGEAIASSVLPKPDPLGSQPP